MWIDEKEFVEKFFQEEYAQQKARKILEVDEKHKSRKFKKKHIGLPVSSTTLIVIQIMQKPTKDFLSYNGPTNFEPKIKSVPMVLEKMKSQTMDLEEKEYNVENPWSYFVWWREQFFDF